MATQAGLPGTTGTGASSSTTTVVSPFTALPERAVFQRFHAIRRKPSR